MKKIIFMLTALIALGIAAQAFAADVKFRTPPEILAQLLGKDVPTLLNDMEASRKSLAVMADEAGVFEKFKAEMLAVRKSYLNERVAYGSMTRQEADNALKIAEERFDRSKDKDFNRDGRGHKRDFKGYGGCGMGEGREGYGHGGGHWH